MRLILMVEEGTYLAVLHAIGEAWEGQPGPSPADLAWTAGHVFGHTLMVRESNRRPTPPTSGDGASPNDEPVDDPDAWSGGFAANH